ncbi:hypothetical protein DE146DRAFT_754990 [Phaeosphaeria sp. MPI-PUGE-AT-0046c]|nr:hypothetical protein DE146DRAFT_754990 [Phaeosphaeria sp. MPI-PUGE-AT-0046c]
MFSLTAAEVIVGLLAVRAAAQSSPVELCTNELCDNCPAALASIGPPQGEGCVIYDRETVLGQYAGEFAPELNGRRNLWFHISPPDELGCKLIVRSPADIASPKCGDPVKAPVRERCTDYATETTFNVQLCCGTQQCKDAGVERIGARSAYPGAGVSSVVLRDVDGNLIVPHSVGGAPGFTMDTFLEDQGFNASEMITERSSSGVLVFKKRSVPEALVEKRACDIFEPNEKGVTYTSSASKSTKISRNLCWETQAEFTEAHDVTVSRSTSFSAGISWEILSAGVEFSVEESVSESRQYTLKVPEGACGFFSFTAFMTCQAGKIRGCDNGDLEGEVCTPKRLADGQLDGSYSFVET